MEDGDYTDMPAEFISAAAGGMSHAPASLERKHHGAPRRMPYRAKAIYMYLKDRSNKEGQCYQSIGTIARELQLSRRTVERGIDDLIWAGLHHKGVALA